MASVPPLLDHPAPRAACPARRPPTGPPHPARESGCRSSNLGSGFWRPREEGEENLGKNAGARGVSRWASVSGRKTKTGPGGPASSRC